MDQDRASLLTRDGGGTRYGSIDEDDNSIRESLLGQMSKRSLTQQLAREHGVTDSGWMYLRYYVPIMNWIWQYKWSYLRGDFVAALTMASFYIPISLSYAANLGHIPPINGLYSFVFNPLVYAILGSCPLMVVGPEAAGSLLTGGVVRSAINAGLHDDGDGHKNAQVAGMVTSLAGVVILIAGLCRLGFLNSVLSKPFLRGFISAIGVVIFVDQLVTEMGLDAIAAKFPNAAHGSSMEKIIFIARHGHEAHTLTCIVSFTTIFIVFVLREVKQRLQPRMNWVAYVPDRFIVVLLAAILSWQLRWASKGVAILGDIKSAGTPFQPEFPFAKEHFKYVDDAFGTAFLIALLGFFESSVAAKSLGSRSDKDDLGMSVSSNRELVALGVANLVGGSFMALPAFGGYGRSKVNASTGGKTPMSSIFLSLITVLCTLYLLPYFYYIPKGVLSAMISIVAYSLIEEAPHEVLFFYRICGWSELVLMVLIFLTTFFWNLRIGIAVGIGLSLLRLLRHATQPRIQILGRVPDSPGEFENAEAMPVEFAPNCLIVKIPEPLTFANTGSLQDRLSRLEKHGSSIAHPALPRLRAHGQTANLVFDIHGVTGMDPAAAAVLLEIVQAYRSAGTRVFFCRCSQTEVWRLLKATGIVELCGGEDHFLKSVDEALRCVSG
ncbi:sulfate transporter [Piedraia hortae CBS 480.64]|uniref:Sulfate transporter n=1 Tax=Piedraia hortae CBS 480.64 TaxID=1314780 RepID=A0A6A7C220_9PEZI|nr:sulfate transporter [Piedraia hortae CBS 480.64]